MSLESRLTPINSLTEKDITIPGSKHKYHTASMLQVDVMVFIQTNLPLYSAVLTTLPVIASPRPIFPRVVNIRDAIAVILKQIKIKSVWLNCGECKTSYAAPSPHKLPVITTQYIHPSDMLSNG